MYPDTLKSPISLSLITVFLILLVMGLPAVAAKTDLPYSFPPRDDTCDNAYLNSVDNGALINGAQEFRDSFQGVNDTGFTGQTLTSIGFYMCSVLPGGEPGCPPSSPNPVTLGVFDANTGALLSSFGNVAYSSLNCGTQSPGLVTLSGSYVMRHGNVIGASFSDSDTVNYVGVEIVCASTSCPYISGDNNTVLQHGGVVDYSPTGFGGTCSCTPQPPSADYSFGYALAGAFTLTRSK